MSSDAPGMKVYNRVLQSARMAGQIPKDTRGHWDYYPEGYVPPKPLSKEEKKAKARAARKAKKVEVVGNTVEVSPKAEQILREKLKAEWRKKQSAAWSEDRTDHIKSVGNGL